MSPPPTPFCSLPTLLLLAQQEVPFHGTKLPSLSDFLLLSNEVG